MIDNERNLIENERDFIEHESKLSKNENHLIENESHVIENEISRDSIKNERNLKENERDVIAEAVFSRYSICCSCCGISYGDSFLAPLLGGRVLSETTFWKP